MTFRELADRVLSGIPLSDDDVATVAHATGTDVDDLCAQALRVKEHVFANRVSLCSIINAKSGRCSEDCRFCAQSSHHATQSPHYPFVGAKRILEAAQAMKAAGASRFSVVTSGKGLSDADFDELLDTVRGIRALGLAADASVGILAPERFAALKRAGLSGYHHNLETARSFFPAICTTHDYDEDVQTVRDAMAAGLYVCSGGLFGMGESWAQRAELARTLAELGVPSVPVNFLHPIPGTPLATRPVLSPEEAAKIVALLRLMLPDRHIRICGGRPTVFGEDRMRVLRCGASGLMIGDYLTVKGNAVAADLADLQAMGLEAENR
ncbi:biotin synthase [Desulfobaculum xiamenense]|uniref:Biotin synthase n=1 Tax=Desulfobaculum xiamenense TaxID=995050 RepID=A0A846QIX2_9BACT|nr:biotin synthase BioB [Desulfobaculum xiamenense]NJB68111.1 biotin synthase [Desulfobaculum xiamenense]